MESNLKKRVIVIGGGYAGISLLHKLKNKNNLELILIDKTSSHLLQTHLHKYLSGHYDKNDITFNHEKYCQKNNIEFICDEVTNINYKENYLLTRENSLIKYDYLVVATGSTSIFPKQIDNILQFTKDIKKIENLDYYRAKFFKLLDSKPNNAKILVVGGGVSGLQIATEYAYCIKNRGLDKSNIEVVLIEGMPTLLPFMDPFLVNEATKRCQELGISVVNGFFASKIFEHKILLSNDEEFSYDMLLFVIGATGNSIMGTSADISTNQRNQYVVDEFYKITPYENVFAIGDITQAVDTNTKEFQAPTAQASRMQAELTAKNIIRDIKGLSLINNNISNKGILIDLGGPNCAVGRVLNINLVGKAALWLKKLIYSMHSKKFN